MVDWLRDEVILVADRVVRSGWVEIRAGSEAARELSDLLRPGRLHAGATLPSDFRSPKSIQWKSTNIVTSRPGFVGQPTKGGATTAEVAADFHTDPVGMSARARMITEALTTGIELPPDYLDDIDLHGAPEGGVLEFIARRHERDSALRRRKLESVRRAGRPIMCEVCAFDFFATYGQRGADYIEVHHIVPLHVSGTTSTKLNDLSLLCANCHRMCHRGSWITPRTLATLIANARSTAVM